MNDLVLIYVNLVGKDYQDNYIYEFIFSDTLIDVDGPYWDSYPASGRPEPPTDTFIKKVGRLESELKLDVIQNSDSFSVYDAVDGIIAMAWENIDDYDSYPDHRISFHFGAKMKDVTAKLYEKDKILNFKKHHE